MYFLHPSTLLSLAAFLWPIIAANLETVKIESSFSFCTVNGLGDRVENPFDVIASVSEDATFNIDISTKSSKRGYLAGFGEDAAEGDNYQECQLGVKFYYKGEVSEITFGDWDMEGTVTLSRGFVARITARPGFWFQRDIMPSPNVTVVTGPTKDSQSFSTKLSGLPESKEGVYCTGLDPGVRTYSSEVLAVDLTVSTDKSPDAGSTASGYIGLKAEKALSLSSKMTLKKGCSKSKEQQRCVADRYGFELCGNSP